METGLSSEMTFACSRRTAINFNNKIGNLPVIRCRLAKPKNITVPTTFRMLQITYCNVTIRLKKIVRIFLAPIVGECTTWPASSSHTAINNIMYAVQTPYSMAVGLTAAYMYHAFNLLTVEYYNACRIAVMRMVESVSHDNVSYNLEWKQKETERKLRIFCSD